jgi:fructokinase
MRTRANFVVCGEALIDLIQRPDGLLEPKLGGSPWNLARALGRLGCAVRYRSPLSQDAYGGQLAAALDESAVARTGGRSARPTSLALVKLDVAGHPDYAFYREGVADRDLSPEEVLRTGLEGASVFHVGSLALIPPDGTAWYDLLAELAQQGLCTSVDANMRPMVAPDRAAYAAIVAQVLAQARVVKVSDEDLRALGHAGDPLTAARGLLGPVTAVVVLTLGRQGAWCLTREGEHFQPAPAVTLVDTVGAGDCIYAGFLAALDESGCLGAGALFRPPAERLIEALAFGSRVTAHNLQRPGCDPPWRHEVRTGSPADPSRPGT